jgi:hypothetical protein
LKRPSAQLVAQERHDVVGVGIPPDHGLREDEVVVDVHVEDAARAGDELDGADVVFELLQNLRGQTGRVRQSASGNAVFDTNGRAVGHGAILASADVAATTGV